MTDPGLMAPEFVDTGDGTPPNLRSLGHSSAFRFLAEGCSFVLGLLGAVVAARALGPSGKGLYASIVLLSVFVAHALYLGLGDAAIVLTGQNKASLQRALSGGLAVSILSGLAATAAFWGTAHLAFRGDWERARPAVLIAGLAIPLIILGYNFVSILIAEERIVAASVASTSGTWITTLGLLLLLIIAPLSLTGAALASSCGVVATGVLGAVFVTRGSHLSLRPSWDWSYIRPALRYGVSAELSHLLTLGFLRADLLFVYFLAGASVAGQYSVAMSGTMAISLFPTAVSATTFPRIASLDELSASRLLARVFRLGLLGSTAGALLLMAVCVFAIPLLFGPEFAAAVPAALILSFGGVTWSSQWILCRGQAAQGRPGLQMRSFGISLAVMAALDLLLIPRFGIKGAASAGLIAPTIGLIHCLRAYSRGQWWPLGLRDLVPGGRDVKALVGLVLGFLRDKRLDPNF